MADDAYLSRLEIFSSLRSDQRGTLAALGTVREFRSGEEIFSQGETATFLYGLLEGEVELILTLTERVVRTTIDYEEALTVHHDVLEKPVVVDVLRPGNVFGWSSLLLPANVLTASARCRTSCRSLAIPGAALLTRFEADPALGYQVMAQLVGIVSARLQHRTERLTEVWSEAFGGHPA